MAQAFIAVLTVTILTVMSLRANRNLAQASRLPMQWSITGSVNWTAPRLLALAFMPALAAVLLAAIAIMSVTLSPRPGQEGFVIPGFIAMAVTLVAIHALHIWLIGRSLRSESD